MAKDIKIGWRWIIAGAFFKNRKGLAAVRQVSLREPLQGFRILDHI